MKRDISTEKVGLTFAGDIRLASNLASNMQRGKSEMKRLREQAPRIFVCGVCRSPFVRCPSLPHCCFRSQLHCRGSITGDAFSYAGSSFLLCYPGFCEFSRYVIVVELYVNVLTKIVLFQAESYCPPNDDACSQSSPRHRKLDSQKNHCYDDEIFASATPLLYLCLRTRPTRCAHKACFLWPRIKRMDALQELVKHSTTRPLPGAKRCWTWLWVALYQVRYTPTKLHREF